MKSAPQKVFSAQAMPPAAPLPATARQSCPVAAAAFAAKCSAPASRENSRSSLRTRQRIVHVAQYLEPAPLRKVVEGGRVDGIEPYQVAAGGVIDKAVLSVEKTASQRGEHARAAVARRRTAHRGN